MKITVIGSGYVGLVAGTCFADFGMQVCCLDQDPNKIEMLSNGKIHIYEPGLEEVVRKNLKNKNLRFSTDKHELNQAGVLVIAVGTPASKDGSADLRYLDAVVDEIAEHATSDKFIIIKSTVPVGTAKRVRDAFTSKRPDLNFEIISNPEFLREGSAVHDFMEPDRVVIGCSSEEAKEVARTLYRPLTSKDMPIVFTKNQTAELIKYAANSYLAMRIAFINEIADIAEQVDADIEEIAEGMGYDNRIGRHYLHAGPGYGGSCFPKDTQALSKIAKDAKAPSSIIDSVIKSNDKRKAKMADKILDAIGDPKDKTVAVLGLTFKADTDDMRDSASIDIIPQLVKAGVKVKAYDPCGMDEAAKIFKSSITYCGDSYEAIEGADAAVIITEWSEFKVLELGRVKELLQTPQLIDFRNLYSAKDVKKAGLNYISVGRPCQNYQKSKLSSAA